LGGNIQNPPTIKVKDSILENPVTLSEYEQYSWKLDRMSALASNTGDLRPKQQTLTQSQWQAPVQLCTFQPWCCCWPYQGQQSFTDSAYGGCHHCRKGVISGDHVDQHHGEGRHAAGHQPLPHWDDRSVSSWVGVDSQDSSITFEQTSGFMTRIKLETD